MWIRGATFLVLFFYVLRAVAIADESEVRQRFLAEYPAAAEALKEFYQNVQISISISSLDDRDNSTAFWLIDYAARESALRAVTRHANAQLAAIPALPAVETNVFLITAARQTYTLKETQRPDEYQVTSSGLPLAELIEAARTDVLAPFTPYCVWNHSLADLMTRDDCVLERADEMDGQVVVRYLIPVPGKDITDYRETCTVKLDPAKSWAITAYELEAGPADGPDQVKYETEVAYKGDVRSIPVVRQVKQRRTTKLQGALRVTEKRFEVQRFIANPRPKEDFLLSSFDVSGQTQSGE